MSDLPDNGDVIEFSEIAPGSLVPQPIVTPEGSKPLPPRRYRVEKKLLDQEYLLIDLMSGHAIRVPAHEFQVDKWSVVGADKLAAEERSAPQAKAKEVEAKGAASADSQPSEGLLVAKPLSDLPFVEDSDEEEVDEEEEDPVTRTKTIVKKKVKKKR